MTGVTDDLPLRSATRRITGVSFPAIIHNGGYYLTDIGVYEDGVVECWGSVDLDLFRQKVARGWVVPSVPEGATMSAHHLAHMVVTDAQWAMTPESLVARVEEIVTALNPSRVNLFDMQGEDSYLPADKSGVPGKMRVAKLARGGDATWRDGHTPAYLPKPIPGTVAKAFWRLDDAVHVVSVSLFEDDMVRINGIGSDILMSLDDLRGDDRLGEARNGDRIYIQGLCSFTATDVEFAIPKDDFLSELEIDRDKLLGRETPLTRTIASFKAYNEDPTQDTLADLKAAYESVPEHLRRYCGDMDVKDIPIRIALYGEDQIEGWSHYAVAKSRGDNLPSLKVPKPKD